MDRVSIYFNRVTAAYENNKYLIQADPRVVISGAVALAIAGAAFIYVERDAIRTFVKKTFVACLAYLFPARQLPPSKEQKQTEILIEDDQPYLSGADPHQTVVKIESKQAIPVHMGKNVLQLLSFQDVPVNIVLDTSWIKRCDDKPFEGNGQETYLKVEISDVNLMTPAGAKKYGYASPGYGFSFNADGHKYDVRIPSHRSCTITLSSEDAAKELFVNLYGKIGQNVILNVPEELVVKAGNYPKESNAYKMEGSVRAVFLEKNDHHRITHVGVRIGPDDNIAEIKVPIERMNEVRVPKS